MRRVVTEIVDGVSTVASDGPVPFTWCEEIWQTTEDSPLGVDPGDAMQPLAPETGSFFRMVTLPPDAVVRRMQEESNEHGLDDDGFHQTKTVDYVVVLDGPVELVLDDKSVTLEPGDAVVQRGTRHAWRNHGEQPVRLLITMVAA